MSVQPPERRRRHLMDPANPQRPQPGGMSMTQVQKWVASSLVVTTLLHLVVGLVAAAAIFEDERVAAKVVMLMIAGAFGVICVVAAFAIHQRPLLSPWLVVGLVPAAIGAYWVF
jgi:hypothetical protein